MRLITALAMLVLLLFASCGDKRDVVLQGNVVCLITGAHGSFSLRVPGDSGYNEETTLLLSSVFNGAKEPAEQGILRLAVHYIVDVTDYVNSKPSAVRNIEGGSGLPEHFWSPCGEFTQCRACGAFSVQLLHNELIPAPNKLTDHIHVWSPVGYHVFRMAALAWLADKTQ
ncbi:MAG: hypothetical protein WC712_01625 [Candidatus Brocadiia bacterium]